MRALDIFRINIYNIHKTQEKKNPRNRSNAFFIKAYVKQNECLVYKPSLMIVKLLRLQIVLFFVFLTVRVQVAFHFRHFSFATAICSQGFHEAKALLERRDQHSTLYWRAHCSRLMPCLQPSYLQSVKMETAESLQE